MESAFNEEELPRNTPQGNSEAQETEGTSFEEEDDENFDDEEDLDEEVDEETDEDEA